MSNKHESEKLFAKYVVNGNHAESDYFPLIKEFVRLREDSGDAYWQTEIDRAYELVLDEICNNRSKPTEPIKFGTSGWRGQLGKDVFAGSVACVTEAIVDMYEATQEAKDLLPYLGVDSFADAKERGCVVGHDNRFAGGLLATVVAKVLSEAGFKVYFAGESTTGVLSAVVLEKRCAFSVNLTPSHNPLEYGGYKFNAADGGPAAAEITETITQLAREKMSAEYVFDATDIDKIDPLIFTAVEKIDSLAEWKNLVQKNRAVHGLDLKKIMESFAARPDVVVAIDSVHGASRLHMRELLPSEAGDRVITLRDKPDVTFGGIAPEPSSVNMQNVSAVLAARNEPLKLGAIIDPDGDRIRFTDGSNEISMNQFGAMAYHYLYVHKKKRGQVAKTVATSNMANRLAEAFGEDVFEPRVGFKEFKPVIGKALVFFEESDGISIIGHTPEKDAYIGLLLALDMVLSTGKKIGEYQHDIEEEYGAYYPDRDGIEVAVKGDALQKKLNALDQYTAGSYLKIGNEEKKIVNVITIDGRKMILEDGSWLMIRPSGTEPKVRFYVESRTQDGTADLVTTARQLLQQVGVL
ncbi:phosphoglucomutase [Desulfosediminicola flagellatus]|uniref:phosphoglucomutase n=1 Tax=Desulfosediminicola flagellatus TaxID=2569541 RepID=UPI0010AB7CFD|nr:phosphoglucomutase [Desulfosediminicola flagellatus]